MSPRGHYPCVWQEPNAWWPWAARITPLERGKDRQDVVFSEEDRAVRLSLVTVDAADMDLRPFGVTLMTNYRYWIAGDLDRLCQATRTGRRNPIRRPFAIH